MYHRCLTSVIWTTEDQQAFSPCQTSGSSISSLSHCEKTEVALCCCQMAHKAGEDMKGPTANIPAPV